MKTILMAVVLMLAVTGAWANGSSESEPDATVDEGCMISCELCDAKTPTQPRGQCLIPCKRCAGFMADAREEGRKEVVCPQCPPPPLPIIVTPLAEPPKTKYTLQLGRVFGEREVSKFDAVMRDCHWTCGGWRGCQGIDEKRSATAVSNDGWRVGFAVAPKWFVTKRARFGAYVAYTDLDVGRTREIGGQVEW